MSIRLATRGPGDSAVVLKAISPSEPNYNKAQWSMKCVHRYVCGLYAFLWQTIE